MTWIVSALQIVLALVFVGAGAAKALRPEEFVAALRLSHLPGPVALFTAVVVPSLEVLLAFWLILATPDRLPVAFLAGAALLLALRAGWGGSRRADSTCGAVASVPTAARSARGRLPAT
jgi:hypothetical protein